MNNRMRFLVLLLLICLGVSGCSIGGSYSKSIRKISGSSSSWTGEKRKELEFEKGQTVTFRYRSRLDSGELGIQLLDPHGGVIHEFEVNEKGKADIEIMEDGTFVILMSGTEFRGNYQVEW
jgi:hypothetical protein